MGESCGAQWREGGKELKERCWKKKKKKDNGRKGVERQGGRKMRGTKKKTKWEGEAAREGQEDFFCGSWTVTGVPIEWPAMTVPLENADYASRGALMEPERRCSCLPQRGDIVNRTRRLDAEPRWRIGVERGRCPRQSKTAMLDLLTDWHKLNSVHILHYKHSLVWTLVFIFFSLLL